MAAYLIVDITQIHDARNYELYRSKVSPALAVAGGRYLARGGPVDVLEGVWRPNRIVLVEFPSADAARQWFNSDEYTPLRRLRQASTATNMILIEGASEQWT